MMEGILAGLIIIGIMVAIFYAGYCDGKSEAQMDAAFDDLDRIIKEWKNDEHT